MTATGAFTAERRGGVVYLRGELDLAGEHEARAILLLSARQGRSLTVDVSGLDFADSTAVQVMRDALAMLEGGRSVRLIGANRVLRRVFEISGLSNEPGFTIHPP